MASSLHVDAHGASVAETLPPERPEFPPLLIRIHWQGGPRWTIDGEPIATLDAVGTTLLATARIKRDLAVIVDPDKGVPLGDVMDVYDLARQAGLERVQFAALASGEK